MPVSNQPHISLNKLSEYLITAHAARRQKILFDQKFPQDMIVIQYRRFKEPALAFLESDGNDELALLDAISRLRAVSTGTDHNISDAARTADALERFLRLSPKLLEPGYVFQRPPDGNPLSIAGVRVSVTPDALITREHRGRKLAGVLKFHHVKDPTKRLAVDGGEFAATLMYQWLGQNCPTGYTPDRKLCLHVETWHDSVVTAPAAYVRRMRDVEAACDEIAAIWPNLRAALA